MKLTRKDILSIYFGVPGSGKTTFAAYLAKHDLKRGGRVFSNVPIKGCMQYNARQDLGQFDMSNSRIILDEVGIEFNNREFKDFKKRELEFFKLHRHYQTAIDVFSQSYDDMDKKIRCLAQRLYVVKRSLIPFCIVRRTIGKKIGINELTKEITDEYYFIPFSRKIIFMPLLWKLFDSYDCPELDKKDFNFYP